VSNCNFNDNSARSLGGAVCFLGSGGTVTNCNFTNNSASSNGGAVYFSGSGTVTNCNFTGNTAAINGGAINMGLGTVSNCNFTGNNATTGSAIYFYKYYSEDTLTISNSIFLNNRANAEALEVTENDNNITITFKGQNNLLNAIYSRNDAEVTFTNVTYWSATGIAKTGSTATTPSRSNKAAGQNITVSGLVNDNFVSDIVYVTDENGAIVLNIGTGDNYYISVRHDTDSYYTEAKKTISNNTKFNVNVTSQTTHNKTVNITAKSNIYSEVMPGKLLFILPNTYPIAANYGGNGTWWAVHTFYDYEVYGVNATYIGLDNVTINNATMTITKANSTITLVDFVLDYGDSIKVYVKTEGAWLITAMIDEEEVGVFKNTIPISGLDAGNHTLTVTTIPDYDHVEVTKTVNITVKKVDSTLAVVDVVFDYGGAGSAAVSFTGATGVKASVVGHPDAKVNVAGNTITVSGLNAGTYNLTVTTIADANHNNITKTAKITVNKLKTELSASAISTTYNVNKDLVITLTDAKGNPLSGVIIGVNLGGGKFTTDRNGQVKINVANLVPKTYAVKITFNGDTNYDKSTNDVKVTVNKATPKLSAAKKTFKKSVKTKKYTITLKTNQNKVMKGAKVTLKVKGKTYTATTNAKGQATFKIKNLKKKGTFKATVTYNGDKYYNKVVKKNVKIIVK
jgi:predicted outer membrane repeat protein